MPVLDSCSHVSEPRQRLKTDGICLNVPAVQWQGLDATHTHLRSPLKCQALPWSWIVNRHLQRTELFPVSTPYGAQKVHILNNCGGDEGCAVWKPVLFKLGSVPKEGTDMTLRTVYCVWKNVFRKSWFHSKSQVVLEYFCLHLLDSCRGHCSLSGDSDCTLSPIPFAFISVLIRGIHLMTRSPSHSLPALGSQLTSCAAVCQSVSSAKVYGSYRARCSADLWSALGSLRHGCKAQ